MRKIISAALAILLALAGFAMFAQAQDGSYVTYAQDELYLAYIQDEQSVAYVQNGQYVTYAQFGAVGDGIICDFSAIIQAHNYANDNNLPVRIRSGGTYRIEGIGQTATIQTSTDWGDARFIVDNAVVPYAQRSHNIFVVTSRLAASDLSGVDTLSIGQENIGITLPQRSLVFAEDDNVRQYIRRGHNANQGTAKRDMFIVYADGTVCPETPILWDFEQVTSLRAYPIDDDTQLTITGGHFTTIENQSGYESYFGRGLQIRRSNVVVDGLRHEVADEVPGLAPPNSGFMIISNAVDVTVQNSDFAGRIRARHGSYDIQMSGVANILFYNIGQTNCIHDWERWGIMGANRGRNIVFDNVEISRFDFHSALNNATIRNSTIGHSGIAIIGGGTLLIENTTVYSGSMINLRHDQGSSWNGDVYITNSTFRPNHGGDVVLINITNDGRHDFGMPTYMPRNVTIDGLHIYDGHAGFFRRSMPFYHWRPAVFGTNHQYGNDALLVTLLWDAITNCRPPYAMQRTESITVSNITTESGRRLSTSKNIWRFWNMRITRT